MAFPFLQQPLSLKSCELKNRLVLPPMATEKASQGIVSHELCHYYENMSHGGYFGLIFIEHSYVSPEGQAIHISSPSLTTRQFQVFHALWRSYTQMASR